MSLEAELKTIGNELRRIGDLLEQGITMQAGSVLSSALKLDSTVKDALVEGVEDDAAEKKKIAAAKRKAAATKKKAAAEKKKMEPVEDLLGDEVVEYTEDDLKDLLRQYVVKTDAEHLKGVLGNFGAKKFSDIAVEAYGDLFDNVTELMNE